MSEKVHKSLSGIEEIMAVFTDQRRHILGPKGQSGSDEEPSQGPWHTRSQEPGRASMWEQRKAAVTLTRATKASRLCPLSSHGLDGAQKIPFCGGKENRPLGQCWGVGALEEALLKTGLSGSSSKVKMGELSIHCFLRFVIFFPVCFSTQNGRI